MNKSQKVAFGIQLFAIITSCLFAIGAKAQTQIPGNKSWIINGVDHTDTQGNVINAHGGGLLKVGNYYYLIGENRHNDVLVSCYRSADLINWEFRGDLLTRQSHPKLDKANIERPKVIYNEKTKQFVMWMHYEYGRDYSYARAAIAYSSNIEKPFTFVKSFRPFENMSRDCTLYKDNDGTAYFFSSARENYDLCMYKLTDDYLDAKEHVNTLWPGGHREAPALVKRGEYYFLITSGCTGWDPNQAKYAFSKSMSGPWSELKDIGSPMTFDTQPTFILPVKGVNTTNYLYFGDRWDPSQYHKSKYIYLPLTFKNDTTMEMEWVNKLSPNLVTGEFNYEKEKPTQYRIKSKWTGEYLALQEKQDVKNQNIADYRLTYTQTNFRWEIDPTLNDYIRIKHVKSGMFIDATENNQTKLNEKMDSETQFWKVVRQNDNWCKLVNKSTNKALTIERSQNNSDELLFTSDYQEKYDPRYDKQGFLLAPIYE
ncbi:MAG: family 43 glycosylhydrolase [Paludibacter sp.]|nr:family 43 glycosylhydrolase [Paludibacter sp.]